MIRSEHALILDQVRKASGDNKIRILSKSDSEWLKSILIYAYDPFRKFYIKKLPVKGNGFKHINQDTFILLDALATRTITGNEAKQMAVDHVKELTAEEATIFCNILKGNLKIGMGVKNINKAFPGLIEDFNVMLAEDFEKHRFRKGMLASLKIDGLRGFWDGKTMRTRNGHPIEGVSHITKHLGKRQLDGELKDPKLHFQQSSGDTRSFRESPGVHFFVFDIPEEPMPLAERYQYLVEIANEEGWGTSSKPVHLLKHIPMQSLEHVSRNFNKALDNGFEGLVIKNHKALYTPKRGFDWMKLKNKRTTEGSVIGFKEGNESLEGTLGALIIRLYNHVEVDVGIGFSLALRGEIWRNREAWLGCTIEVEFHEFTPDGSLRHPRFKKRRIDK